MDGTSLALAEPVDLLIRIYIAVLVCELVTVDDDRKGEARVSTSTEFMPGGFSTKVVELNLESFQIESEKTGGRYNISVSLPDGADKLGPLPVVYALDAQWHGGGYEKAHNGLMKGESLWPAGPFIQVNIGYTMEDGDLAIALRNHDLVPPGDAFPEGFREYLSEHLGSAGELASDEKLDFFFKILDDPRADLFLSFLEDDLHPLIKARYHVSDEDAGIYGFSYGGLFALYALVTQSTLFTRFGASSAGLLTPNSAVFTLYQELASTDISGRQRHVHFTIGGGEAWGRVSLYRKMTIEILKLHNEMLDHPVDGLKVTSHYIEGEDHETGIIESYKSFARACYPDHR